MLIVLSPDAIQSFPKGVSCGRSCSYRKPYRKIYCSFQKRIFSWMITLLANLQARKHKLPVQQTAWYPKKLPTFSDALALVKETLFMQHYFATSLFHTHIRKPHPTRSAYPVPHAIHAFSGRSFG